jgi:hypothetical protein
VRLMPKVVGDVLEETLGWRIEMTPYGFELRNDLLVPERARLRRGSGIAGQGDVWALVRLPDGSPIVTKIDTKAKLVRAVMEFMAGPPPAPLADHTAPRAKRVVHPRTGGARFVWYRRRKKQKAPSPLDVDCPRCGVSPGAPCQATHPKHGLLWRPNIDHAHRERIAEARRNASLIDLEQRA